VLVIHATLNTNSYAKLGCGSIGGNEPQAVFDLVHLFILIPRPPEKTGEVGAESARPTPRGFRTVRAPLATWRKKEASHRDTSLFRIFGEKGSNFVQVLPPTRASSTVKGKSSARWV
jgi:hypothetical protein